MWGTCQQDLKMKEKGWIETVKTKENQMTGGKKVTGI